MILRIVLSSLLVVSAIATCFSAGFFLVFIEEGLQKQRVRSRLSIINWLCFPLAVAVYLAIPSALVVVFTSDPLRQSIAIVLLLVPPVLIPLITLLTGLRAGWEEITGHPAAYGGHPPGRLATIGSLVLMQGLYLVPPLSAWLLVSSAHRS